MTDDQAYPAWDITRDVELEISMNCDTSTRIEGLGDMCGASKKEFAKALIEDVFGPYGQFFTQRDWH